MSAELFTPTLAVASVQELAPLKVVGVYADLPAHVLGMRILRNVAGQCSPVCAINAAWWSFDTLKSADVHETAARDADMIWCSAHACEALPHAVRAFLDESAENQLESAAALVALLRCPHGYKIEESPARIYLSKTAQASGMELFVHAFDCGCNDVGSLEAAAKRPPFDLNALHQMDSDQPRNWRIND